MVQFENRTAWITGASSGLGKALAQLMARQGWRVAASARSEEDLAVLAGESEGLAGKIVACPCDITEPESVAEALEEARAALGPIELAVLNAGTHRPVRAKSFSAETFRLLTEINLMGTVNCIEALLPDMIARGNGRISVVASVAGYRGLPTSSAYGMTKAGLINMCEALKPELDFLDVDMQVICPGFVKTPLTEKNDFEMPFLMETDDAARAMLKGLESDRFHVAFPWQMGLSMRLLAMLPPGLAFRITRKMMPRRK